MTENFVTMLDMSNKQIAISGLKEIFQVIVIEYANGEFESFALPYPDTLAGDAVVSAVKANIVSEIKSIVCMWSDGDLDLPSHTLRISLCNLCEKNRFAKILLQGENSLIVKEMWQTQP